MTQPDTPSPPDLLSGLELDQIESQIAELRNQIGDLGSAIDTFKAKKGGAIGGGVFLMLLALIAIYDVRNGKANLWLAVGISGGLLKYIAGGFVIAALAAFALAVGLEKNRDHLREAKLAELQQQLETLLVRKSVLESP